MARGNFDSLVLSIRLDRKDRALQNALLVPWRELAASAAQYVQWHAFVLWVRTIMETASGVPDVIQSELRACCPDLVDRIDSADLQPIWKRLEEWIDATLRPRTGRWLVRCDDVLRL